MGGRVVDQKWGFMVCMTCIWKKHSVPDRSVNSSYPCQVALFPMQNSDFLYQPLFAPVIHTFSISPPVAFYFPQSLLSVFHWQTFYLTLPHHMMWDKCTIPYLWAFQDCNTPFTRWLFDSRVDKLQSYSWPPSQLAKWQSTKVGFACKMVNNKTQILE